MYETHELSLHDILKSAYSRRTKLGVDGFSDHYEGGYLFRDKINLEAIPDDSVKGGWRLKFGYDSRTPNRATTEADATPGDGLVAFRVPVKQTSKPGIDAHLVLTARGWA